MCSCGNFFIFFWYTFGPFFFFFFPLLIKKSYRTVHYVIYKFVITYTVVILMAVKLYICTLISW